MPMQRSSTLNLRSQRFLIAGIVFFTVSMLLCLLGYFVDLPVRSPRHPVEVFLPFALCLVAVVSLGAGVVVSRRLEALNRHARVQTQAVLRALPDLVWLKDPEGVYLACNTRFEQFFGATEAAIVGKTDFDFVDAELAAFFREKDQVALAADRPCANEEWVTFASDGHRELLLTVKTPMRDADGNLIGVLGMGRDVTDLMEAEEKLRASEERYRSLFENNPAPMVIYERESLQLLAANEAFLNDYGYQGGEIHSLRLSDLHPEEEQAAVVEIATGLVGHANVGEWHHRHRDGALRTIVAISHDLPYQGRSARVVVITDITERKAMEEQLRSITDSVHDAIVMMNGTGEVSFWNPAAERIFGYSREEALGRSMYRLLAPDPHLFGQYAELEGFLAAGPVHAAGKTLELTARRKEGTEIRIALSLSAVLLHGSRQAVGVVRDVTELRRAEAALLHERDFSDALLRALPGIFYLFDMRGDFLRWNRNLEQVTGYTGEEITAMTPLDFFVVEDRAHVAEGIQRAFETGAEHLEAQVVSKEGARAPYFLTGVRIILDEQPCLLGMGIDISERRKAEEALRESETRLRFALEGSNDGLWDVQLPAGGVYFSPRGCRILGYEPDEMEEVARVWSDLVHPDDMQKTLQALQAHLDGKTPVFEVEQRLRTKSGVWKWILTRGKVVESAEGGEARRITGTHTDITERKQLEEQLRQAQKMEAIGQLAGGLAHDFNNILQVIIGFSSVLQSDERLDERQRDKIDHILSAAEKAAQLTRGLLTFSRKQVVDLQVVDLNTVIRNIHKLIVRVISEDIKVRLSCCDTPLTAYVDGGQIEQVLVNLATNARDAMPRGGMLSIETEVKELDPAYLGEAGRPGGRYGVISVSDTGLGMDQETQRKIFEPFFTTKEVGKGTGLGMSIVHGIVQQHHGFIRLYSEPGVGTTFRIYLPLSDQAAVPDAREVAGFLPAGGDETILLAEDDGEVRSLMQKILSEFGYRVLCASNGQDAVDTFLRHQDEIRLLVMDMIMPVKSGAEVYRELKTLRPKLKVLFSSGYTMDIIRDKGELGEGTELLMKPVHPMELLRKVRAMLDVR